MSDDEFRALALSFPGAVESAHMDHPDFRVGGKIFATLGYPGRGWGMVALTADEQALVVQAEPDVFTPVKGAWGRGGATQVNLKTARKRSLRTALEAAWRRRAPKTAAGRTATPKAPARRRPATRAARPGRRRQHRV
jgi:hypothetical protein